jgi:ACS family hexuronate transporter-like MFS transporter
MGGFFMNIGAGWLRENTGTYEVMFIIAGVTYLVAVLLMHLIVPKLEPANLEGQ